jgi:hypothetical protein
MPEVMQGNCKIHTSKLDILKLTDNREKAWWNCMYDEVSHSAVNLYREGDIDKL